MIRKAIVAGIGADWIDCLSLDETERAHDEACGSGGSCGSSGCGCRVSGRPFKAARPSKLEVKVGDTVEVSAPGSRAFMASLAVLGVPILAGAAGWIIAAGLAPGLSEAGRAGIAALALLTGAGITVLAGSGKKNAKLPEITGIAG